MPHHLHQTNALKLRHPLWMTFCVSLWTCGSHLSDQALAGPAGSAQTTAEKEIARRQALLSDAELVQKEAALLFDKGDYAEAARLYRHAWESLPDAPLAAGLKAAARDGYSRSALAEARKLASSGRYPESRALTQSILQKDFDPQNAEALKFLQQLDDPDRFEPALTPQHTEQVAKVETLLRDAHSFINLGDYDSANSRFMEVLRIDRYNSAARRGMEQVEQRRQQYFTSARDQARARALSDVDRTWEAPLADVSGLFGSAIANQGAGAGQREGLAVKLRSLIIPRVSLQDASLEEVVEFLRIRSRDLDPQRRGIDFVLKVPTENRNAPVTLNLTQIPLEEVLRYATQASGTAYRFDDFAVTITSATEPDNTILVRQYRVPPDFIQTAAVGDTAPGAAPNPFAQGGGNVTQGLTVRRLGAREFLEQRGIAFPEGTSASYNPVNSTLFVRNTAENLALIDAIVEQAASSTPKQVDIQVRLIEVNETRLRELGFDWLLGQFDVPGTSGRVFAGGGTTGNQRASSFGPGEFPFTGPNGQTLIGSNPITAGLRGASAITSAPSIDALIGRATITAADARSPGAFAVSGVFTDPQYQTVIRTLSQSKGVDLLASPNVVARSGERATITISREFRYPTEFDPPQIPQNIANNVIIIDGNTGEVIPNSVPIVPVLPSTPTAFEMRDVGIILEAEPVVSADNRTVELNLVPSSTEFEGFVDYGTDITNSYESNFGAQTYNVENNILQPIFRLNKVSTSVTVWDGQTVVLGGVMYEKAQDVDDKVPFLGDVPVIGRAFKSKVRSLERKNVIFFVTVRIIDPSGNNLNNLAPPATVAR